MIMPLCFQVARWATTSYKWVYNFHKYPEVGLQPQLPFYKAIYKDYNPIYNW